MYEISGFTKTNSAFEFDKETARIEFTRALDLLKSLSRYHAGFTDLSHLSDEGALRGEELAEYLLSTDVPDPELLEEWEQLNSGSDQVKVNENAETVFESMWKQTQALNAEFGTRLLNITLKSSAARGVELSRSIDFDANSPPLVKLSLPMNDPGDFWYQDANTARDLMLAVMDAWEFNWIVARPSMYQGMNKQLFKDRATFGWMGWTSKQFDYSGDALSYAKPLRDGTFMLLQERMMNLQKPDVEKCNRAEAALLDRGVLNLISEI